MYMECLRLLLGVRKTTAGDLCLMEANLPSLAAHTKRSQLKLIRKLRNEREDMADDPFHHAWHLAREANSPMARYILTLDNHNPEQERETLKKRIENSERTKYITYRSQMNPALNMHPMYRDAALPENERIVTTKFRLSSHNLAIEKGRWQRKPREERLCPACNIVQDEQHALRECILNEDVRRENCANANLNLPDFFVENPNSTKLCYLLMHKFV